MHTSAVRTRTVSINQRRALLVTAPAELREQLAIRSAAVPVETCLCLSETGDPADPTTAANLALRSLARRYAELTDEIKNLEVQLHRLIKTTAPRLLALPGVGYATAAQLLITAGDNPDRLRSEAAFANLCGVAPIPASSGKTNRHRLSRGGHRQANRALHMITVTRLAHCPRTRAYRQRRAAEQLSTSEIMRCLKRYIARETYRALTCTDTAQQDTTEGLDKS